MAEEVLEERISRVLEENGEPFVSSNIAKIFAELLRVLVKRWLAKKKKHHFVLRGISSFRVLTLYIYVYLEKWNLFKREIYFILLFEIFQFFKYFILHVDRKLYYEN